jgi:hypothetical protein
MIVLLMIRPANQSTHEVKGFNADIGWLPASTQQFPQADLFWNLG